MTRYLRAANVKDGELDLADVKAMNFELKEQQIFSLRPGDVLVTEGSGSLTSVGASAVWNGELDGTVCFQNTLLRLRPRQSTDGRFLAWWCRHAFADGLFASVSTGANIFHLSADRVRSLPMVYVPLERQRAIADFLDTETARIDALITKKRRMIDLLEERFWESVTAAIAAADGVCAPLRRALRAISDGPFGSSLTSSHYSTAGARVVRLGNIGLGVFKDDDKAFIPLAHYEDLSSHRVRPGDLLIAGLGDARHHVGRACVAPDLGPAIVKADCYCAQVDQRRAHPAFLSLLLSSPAGAQAVAIAARGTTRSRINLDIAKELSVPLPAPEVQLEVVMAVEEERRVMTSLTDLLGRQITLLHEHRHALITAAVTGELEVPGVAA